MAAGQVIKEFDAPGVDTYDLAFDGRGFWTIGIADDNIYHIDIDGNIIYTISGVVLNLLTPVGIEFDGKCLIVVDEWLDKLHKYDIEGNEIVAEVDTPAANPRCITFDGKYYWLSCKSPTNRTYQLDADFNLIRSFAAVSENNTGLASDGRVLFQYESTTNENKIHVFSKAGILIRSFEVDTPAKGVGLTFDGKNLWTSDITNEKIYCIAIN